MGKVVLHHGTGAGDFEIAGDPIDPGESKRFLSNARRLLHARGQSDAIDVLELAQFAIFPATNHLNDDFHVLHADVPLSDYEAVRVKQERMRRGAALLADAISEAEGPYVRFVSVGLILLAEPENWDVFLCHASEDKATVARPLYNHLDAVGVQCWLDEAEILWGDSIVTRIQEGLARARFVIVVLSPSFLRKGWTQMELRTALTLEIEARSNLVLPLLVGDPASLLTSYPFLKDKRYFKWEGNPAQVEQELRAVLRKQARSVK